MPAPPAIGASRGAGTAAAPSPSSSGQMLTTNDSGPEPASPPSGRVPHASAGRAPSPGAADACATPPGSSKRTIQPARSNGCAGSPKAGRAWSAAPSERFASPGTRGPPVPQADPAALGREADGRRAGGSPALQALSPAKGTTSAAEGSPAAGAAPDGIAGRVRGTAGTWDCARALTGTRDCICTFDGTWSCACALGGADAARCTASAGSQAVSSATAESRPSPSNRCRQP